LADRGPKRVLIIDDLHHAPADSDGRAHLLPEFERRFDRIVILGADEFYYEELICANKDDRKSNALWAYDLYRILPFGYLRCEQFVRNWVGLGETKSDELEDKVTQINGLLTQFLRNNLIPQYPWVVMIIRAAGRLTGAAARRKRLLRLPAAGPHYCGPGEVPAEASESTASYAWLESWPTSYTPPRQPNRRATPIVVKSETPYSRRLPLVDLPRVVVGQATESRVYSSLASSPSQAYLPLIGSFSRDFARAAVMRACSR